ncbi:MAG: aspartate carbamoyltransferase [Burkholderiaceae bacterium]
MNLQPSRSRIVSTALSLGSGEQRNSERTGGKVPIIDRCRKDPVVTHCFRMALALAVSAVVAAPGPAVAQTTQEHVHHMGQQVMPFDLSISVHIFRMTESGGVQRVILRDPKAVKPDQIALIRQHLQHEAKEFQRGNFADPATLHGATMPGLKELQAGSSKIKVSYSALPTGAQITFETSDVHALTAIHRWFGAQLSQHGADAMSE